MEIIELYNVDESIDELSDLLINVVGEGASIGFLPPLTKADADSFWESCVKPDVFLWIAKVDEKIAATLQLHLCTKPNGTHRAEIAKLMTHPSFRQKGMAKQLMLHAEKRAKQEGRSLLILDTREGDPSNFLYQSLGYKEAGRIPSFAQNAEGGIDTTVLYYKMI
ncbi:GNAT family N-acetyltransferase [Fictibacillus sp. b24]|uniref:GNAT family N-acetyltransferase n=1 Tax=Fictibacillus sp. b24 TaxID=3055863 RepID=UPI0025A097E2|nr:GNAT family N-acetyltransferase [Fictibacillus sp. b24]MDM5317324.1 GNAT family N-acetyltransferase [Fictibacillus sp. b24]